MSLNIKNSDTTRLIYELSSLTGESLTGAVTVAVRERLDRLHSEQEKDLANRLVEIGKDCASRLKEPFRTLDHAELLYDEKGMPR